MCFGQRRVFTAPDTQQHWWASALDADIVELVFRSSGSVDIFIILALICCFLAYEGSLYLINLPLLILFIVILFILSHSTRQYLYSGLMFITVSAPLSANFLLFLNLSSSPLSSADVCVSGCLGCSSSVGRCVTFKP